MKQSLRILIEIVMRKYINQDVLLVNLHINEKNKINMPIEIPII